MGGNGEGPDAVSQGPHLECARSGPAGVAATLQSPVWALHGMGWAISRDPRLSVVAGGCDDRLTEL